MAEALFTKYTGMKAFSAGTKVFKDRNQKIKDISLAEPVVRFMKKEGINIRKNIRTQTNPKMIKQFDKIIIMAEPETIPSYLSSNDKIEIWDIKDPKGRSDKDYEKIISQIKNNIKQFIKDNNLPNRKSF